VADAAAVDIECEEIDGDKSERLEETVCDFLPGCALECKALGEID